MNLKVRKILEESIETPAVILPLSYNGILFTRALKSKHIPVIGIIKSKKDCFYHTNSCAKIISSDLYGEHALANLIEAGKLARKNPALIPTSDEGVKFILSNLKVLKKYYLINIPQESTANLLLDKQSLYAWGNDRYPFPKTLIIKTEQELNESLEDLFFPVIIKPNYRDANWPATLDKAVLADDAQIMIKAFHKFIPHADACLVSEYIPGGDENIETCHVFYDEGKLVNSYTDQKIRQYPPLTGTGSYISSCYNPEIKKITINFFDDHDNYTGVGGIEFKKHDITGEYKIIEPFVGRPSSHFYTGLGEGFNFPFIVYCQIVGKEIPKYEQSYKIVSQLDEEFELQACREYLKSGKMSIGKYLKTIVTTELFVRFSIKDPSVGFVYFFQVISRLLRKPFTGMN